MIISLFLQTSLVDVLVTMIGRARSIPQMLICNFVTYNSHIFFVIIPALTCGIWRLISTLIFLRVKELCKKLHTRIQQCLIAQYTCPSCLLPHAKQPFEKRQPAIRVSVGEKYRDWSTRSQFFFIELFVPLYSTVLFLCFWLQIYPVPCLFSFARNYGDYKSPLMEDDSIISRCH